VIVPLHIGGITEHITLKIDSKGRLCIPAEIREEIGDTATLKKTSEGYLIIPGKQENFLKEFQKVIESKHKRTGEPENWSPEKMKSIWSQTK
jgi:bifunctional DNA-binding transcriptional regulator/antitoxin component of YhaV-PrlF toxin-antitoxin module